MEHTSNLNDGPASKYRILESPSHSGRKLRMICVGGGISALNLAHEVELSRLDLDLVCYERNPSIGGTWYENRYPGCACDIPSVNYQFSWAPSPEWPKFYSSASDILQYLKDVAQKFDLNKYIRLQHTVIGAYWHETEQMWHVKIQKGHDPKAIKEDRANVFVNASGALNEACRFSKWKWPLIEGRNSFKGTMLHTANWDSNVDIDGKRVAVVGSGSSAVQVVSSIQSSAETLKCFIRSPSWVTAGFAQRFAGEGGANFTYSERQREILRSDPRKYLAYRKKIESELNSRFRFILNGSKEQQQAKEFSEMDMRSRLARKPQIADHLIPKNFPVGCRRPTPDNGFLEALCEPNVSVVTSAIKSITPNGIKTVDDLEHGFDIIICATGFDVSWRPRFPTIGREGVNLDEYWSNTPETYLSIAVANFPNYFIFNGPFGPYGHGSFIPITETISQYVMQMLAKMSQEEIGSFAPLEEAVVDFAEHRRAFLPRTAWTAPCRSWFKQGTVNGEPMMWPGSRIHFLQTMQFPRWEDYHLKYLTSNRFAYLGNGFAVRETDGRDLSWYLGLLNGDDKQPELDDEDFADFLLNT